MSNKQKNTEGFMDFESMLRQYFGDKEYSSQGLRGDKKYVRSKLGKSF